MFLGLRFAFGSFEVSEVSNFLMQAGDPVTAMCPWDNSEESPGLAVARIQNACYFDILFHPFSICSFCSRNFHTCFLETWHLHLHPFMLSTGKKHD